MSHAFNHDFDAKQNVFYVNPTSGNDAWSGRYPWHATSVTGTGGVAGQQEGPFATVKHAARHVSTGDSGSAFRGAVVILMSDGGLSGEHCATGDSGANWTHIVGDDGGDEAIFSGSGLGCMVIGGNTGGVVDGTVAEIKSNYAALNVNHPLGMVFLDATQGGVHFSNLDFNSNVGTGALALGHTAIYCTGNVNTNVTNCGFIGCRNAVWAESSKAKLNACHTVDCGHAHSNHPVIYANEFVSYESEYNSSRHTAILMTGNGSDLTSYSSAFVNNDEASIDYREGFASLIDNVFISGATVDVQRSSTNTNRNALVAINQSHLEDSATGYLNNDTHSGETSYVIATVFGMESNKHNLLGNSLTTGGGTTGPETYSVTGMFHNMMEKRRVAHVSIASAKSTVGKNGYYASYSNMSTTSANNIVNERKASLEGKASYILDREPTSTLGNIYSWRSGNVEKGRGLTMTLRTSSNIEDNGPTRGGIRQRDCVEQFNCAELQCCCQQRPAADGSPCSSQSDNDICGYSGAGHITIDFPGSDNTSRDEGHCQTLEVSEGGGTTGDCCCLTGDGGFDTMTISCY